MNKSYSISENEINRRKHAFNQLIINFILSFLILLLYLFLDNITLCFIIVTPYLFFILLFRWYIFKFFQKYLKVKVKIFNGRITKDGFYGETAILKDINHIKILFTKRKTIRSISITWAENKPLTFDAIEKFYDFKQSLIDICPSAAIKELKEFMDFDHPIFYPILGTILGLASGTIFNVELNTNFYLLSLLSAVYTCFVGLYIIIRRPLYDRYGKEKLYIDIVSGSVH